MSFVPPKKIVRNIIQEQFYVRFSWICPKIRSPIKHWMKTEQKIWYFRMNMKNDWNKRGWACFMLTTRTQFEANPNNSSIVSFFCARHTLSTFTITSLFYAPSAARFTHSRYCTKNVPWRVFFSDLPKSQSLPKGEHWAYRIEKKNISRRGAYNNEIRFQLSAMAPAPANDETLLNGMRWRSV